LIVDFRKGGRNLESITCKLGTFWSLLFKLIDDIKESVRNAAELTIKSLNRVTISYSTAISNTQICQQTINSVLPVLIKDGINSKLDQVRKNQNALVYDIH
jgi:proteasome component ECM29